MSDYIKREDTMALLGLRWEAAESRGDMELAEIVKEDYICISNIPSADVVEVVRCKDCKHFEYDHWSKPDDNGVSIIIAHEICNFWNGGCKTSEDGYCSFGERSDA